MPDRSARYLSVPVLLWLILLSPASWSLDYSAPPSEWHPAGESGGVRWLVDRSSFLYRDKGRVSYRVRAEGELAPHRGRGVKERYETRVSDCGENTSWLKAIAYFDGKGRLIEQVTVNDAEIIRTAAGDQGPHGYVCRSWSGQEATGNPPDRKASGPQDDAQEIVRLKALLGKERKAFQEERREFIRQLRELEYRLREMEKLRYQNCPPCGYSPLLDEKPLNALPYGQ